MGRPRLPGLGGAILGHVGHDIGVGLVGAGIGIASNIAENKRQKKAEEAAERQRAEYWVVCAYCGRKFDFTKEGGSYNRSTGEYACTNCKDDAASAVTVAQRWTCPHCGAPNDGDSCEYCGCLRPAENAQASVNRTARQANPGQVYGNRQQATQQRATQQQATASAGAWFCPNCGHRATGKFCTKCGTPRGN